MERSFMKKTMNIFFCALLGAAVLIGGCSDNNKAEAVKEQKTAAAAQKDASLSGARNTPIVAAPNTLPLTLRPSVRLTMISEAPSTTWLLVAIRPDLS